MTRETRVPSRRRLRRRERAALTTASLTALALSASGCVVVHGEREVLPATTRAEAAKALTQFTTAYNKADKAYDASQDADFTTGAFGDIDAARLKARHANSPQGNPEHTPLVLSDVTYTIPKKAGWPRWFVADAHGNRAGKSRWLLVFLRHDQDEPWQVGYLTLAKPGSVPRFKTDADGFAEAVDAGAADLAATPESLSRRYTTYLKSGGDGFADGPYTSVWRAAREKQARRPGLANQYIDTPLTRGDYAPLALRTADGGALVFFTTRHYQKQTAAPGVTVPDPGRDVLALTSGEIKQSLTMEFVSNEVALDPPRTSGRSEVSVLGRTQGMTSAQGS
ncbi:hypothetical protein AB0E88_25240 [Streptomyces sp. NPDC028635]|uniref:hypothetical protein n=1 Tax=Streptomyces sp. NPDC028635 TaxID=3154800 RepID=UPI00340AC694